jgi:hypothetical protein
MGRPGSVTSGPPPPGKPPSSVSPNWNQSWWQGGRDRVALGDALVDDRRTSKPEADSVRALLEDAKRKAEALVYAEQRAAETLSRLPIERKDEWERQALRDLRKACDVYIAAIGAVARARDQLGDEATLVSFLHNEGAYVQAISGALQRPGAHGVTDPIGFAQLTNLMLTEAASVEEKALLDPNRPMPEPQLHLAHTGRHGPRSQRMGLVVLYLCPHCRGRFAKPGLCIDCKRADNQRRNRKRSEQGRTSAAWLRFRQANIASQCERCPATTDLTWHYKPGGVHSFNPADYSTLCRSCHGKQDAPRAHYANR